MKEEAMETGDMNNTLLFENILNITDQETLKHYLFENGCRTPEKKAFEWYDEKTDSITGVTYEQLMQDILSLGTEMYANDFKGKTVALIGGTNYNWVLLFLTVMCGKMTVVPLDPNLGISELEKRIGHCEADIVFCDESIDFYQHASLSENVRLIGLTETMMFRDHGTALLKQGNTLYTEERVGGKDDVLMIFTSGTGGKMKAAVIRQENLIQEREVWYGLEFDKSKCLILLPLYHIAGIGDLRGTLLVGTTAFFGSGIKRLLEDFQYVKPVNCFVVPAQAQLLAGILEGKDPEMAKKLLGGRLFAVRTSGAPLTPKMRELFTQHQIDVTSDYGMTETCGPVSVSLKKNGKVFSKPGSVGHILDKLDVKIADPDEKGRGEILIGGPSVFTGYFHDPEETVKILKDGYIYTGDVGYIDEDRYLYIVGRKKNIIVLSNGENVIPEELEKNILSIDAVKECIVFEKNDKLAVRIYVEADLDDADDEERQAYTEQHRKELEKGIREEIRRINTDLPHYKRIGIVEFSKDPLPKTATGKLLREVH